MFKETKQGFNLRHKLFNGIINIEAYNKEWFEWKVMTMDVKMLSSVRDQYLKDLAAAERGIPDNMALPLFKTKVLALKDSIPIIEALRCPYLQEVDYRNLQQLLQTEIQLQGNLELSYEEFLSLNFQDVQEEIKNIETTAIQCYSLKQELDKFEQEWITL